MPRFYGIPKVHKQNIPLRPIVSQINGPTSKVNELVDYYLSVAETQIPYLFRRHYFIFTIFRILQTRYHTKHLSSYTRYRLTIYQHPTC